MTAIFNEWARRYSETPEEFEDVLDENGKPVEDYGECCTHYFEKIANEMDEAGKLPRPDANDRTVAPGATESEPETKLAR